MNNIMVTTISVFACNRLLDLKEMEQTKEKIEYLLGAAIKMAGIHKILLKIDLLMVKSSERNDLKYDPKNETTG